MKTIFLLIGVLLTVAQVEGSQGQDQFPVQLSAGMQACVRDLNILTLNLADPANYKYTPYVVRKHRIYSVVNAPTSSDAATSILEDANASNINPVDEFVKMIEAQRHWEMFMKTTLGIDKLKEELEILGLIPRDTRDPDQSKSDK